MKTVRLEDALWPADHLGDAVESLARTSGLAGTDAGDGTVSRAAAPVMPDGDRGSLDRYLESAAASLALEAEAVETSYRGAGRLLRSSPPALLEIACKEGPGYLALERGGRRPVAIGPDGESVRVRPDEVLASLRAPLESGHREEVEAIIRRIGPRRPGTAREDALRRRLFSELVPGGAIRGIWLLRPSESSGGAAAAREVGLGSLLTTLIAVHAVEFVLWILAWWLLGRAALAGRLDTGWLLGWGLLLVTLVPLQLLASRAAGSFSIRAGTVLRRRLLSSTFRLDSDSLKNEGAGSTLARVLETDAVEQLAVAGGFLAVLGLVETALAAVVLSWGAGGWLHAGLLVGWLAVATGLVAIYARRRGEWTERRIRLTHDLVERMAGHRTRVAQELPSRWHRGEDSLLESYLGSSARLDAVAARLTILIPRGWTVIGVVGLVPAFLSTGTSQGSLAVGVGGVLLAYQALRRLAEGLERSTAAAVAWRGIRRFRDLAALRQSPRGEPGVRLREPTRGEETGAGTQVEERVPLLDLREVSFRYGGRAAMALRGVSLSIQSGDRLLLEGPSGGGKSTLGRILAGARVPAEGLVLLRGLDRNTLGDDDWRRRTVLVPQFHDNHVFLGPLAFNLLLGRRWPPDAADLREAEAICRELGLGPLIDRMPSGLLQPVGETGWKLSHGECSRLYIARALLQQDAELLIFDESFAALDPPTLRRALSCVLERAPTVLVVAHP